MLFDDDDLDRLRLIRSENVGPVTYRQLIRKYGSARRALQMLPDLAGQGGRRKFVAADSDQVEREIEAVRRAGAKYVFLEQAEYPPLLAQLESAPPVLTYRGNIALAKKDCVAMVGARNASAAACQFARRLALECGNNGILAVSGLARGIDRAAHVGSLESGTIAVIAGGVDIAYPPENAGLQDAIADKGLLFAEFPPGTEPRARHFPYRNRIIAGIAQATLVVEAAPKSGSLITARLAADAGRTVMAIPGSPLDPRARGCNQLIREGAILVQDAADIVEIIKPIDPRMHYQDASFEIAPSDVSHEDTSDNDRKTVVGLLGMTDVSVDELVRQSGVAAAQVQTILLELELAGRLQRGAGARVRLTA